MKTGMPFPSNSCVKKYLFIILLITPFLLTNCITINSIRDPNFNKKIEKIFIAINGNESIEGFLVTLTGNLKNKFYEKNIQTEIYLRKALSLDTADDLESRVYSYQPDVILTIIQTTQLSVNGAISGGDFELSMFEPESKKPVWKAVLEMDSGGWGMGSADEVVEKIIKQLIKDNII